MDSYKLLVGPLISVVILGIPVRLIYDFWLKDKFAVSWATSSEKRRKRRIEILNRRLIWVS